ncbi:MAG: permease [Dehalococcoidia bacterium]|nr:permease [Dehalococcoidia bacterium]MDZ4247183.1 permease [Dehalococcoidia bacterium]
MLIPTLVLGAIALTTIFLGYQKGGGAHVAGLKTAGMLLVQMLPLLVFAFIIAGMVPLLISQETIAKWIGAESGFRGILIGSVAGAFMPGGPYISLPVAAGLLRVGAGVGTLVAFLTGWSVLAFSRLPMDIGIMGWKFTAIRLACSFFFPPLAGFLAERFFGGIKVL